MFDEKSYTAIASAVASLSAHSAFAPHSQQFHITVLDAPDGYTAKKVTTTLRAVSAREIPLQGRFIRWELASDELQIIVKCDEVSRLQQSLKSQGLGNGVIPQRLHVSVGSVRAIDPQQHLAFLAAVETAFPITNESQFLCTQLGYGALHLPKGRKGLQLRGLSTDGRLEKNSAITKAAIPRKVRCVAKDSTQGAHDAKRTTSTSRARASSSAMEIDCRPAAAIRKTRRRPSIHQGYRKAGTRC